jgi:hypothetical protein
MWGLGGKEDGVHGSQGILYICVGGGGGVLVLSWVSG